MGIMGLVTGIRRVFERFLDFGGDGGGSGGPGEGGDGSGDLGRRGAGGVGGGSQDDGGGAAALMADNADWLDALRYIPFLREYGRHFSVNRMLGFESVKLRLDREQPLSFLEFNYMVLQAYDFLELGRRYGCRLQMGGSDQWGNIVCGVELGRRAADLALYGLTAPLLTTAGGAKMGKSTSGGCPTRRGPMETVFPLRTAYRARMDHDGAHKLIYSLPDVVADLLRILAAGWADKLDFSTFERLSSDYIDEDHLKHIGDMLWRVRFREGALKDGSRPCLLMMIEFQSTVDPAMAERIRKYTSMLLRELERNGTAAREGGLPLVLAAVIYNGDRRWTAAGDAADLVARVPSGRAALALAAHQPQAYSLLPVRTDLDADAGPADDAVESRWPADNRVLATARLQRARSASDLLARLHEEMVRFPGVRNAAFRRALHAWARELWSHLTRGRSTLPPFEALA